MYNINMQEIKVVYEKGSFKPVRSVKLKGKTKGYVIVEQKKSLFGAVPGLSSFKESDRADSR